MAKQDPHPESWFETDGCSGVLDFTAAIKKCCDAHDVDYHWGGWNRIDKQRADDAFRANLKRAGWLGRFLAPIRYSGVRRFTWNYPPLVVGALGGRQRRYGSMMDALRNGQTRIEAWNWKGPGRGRHANMEAQPFLLAGQMEPGAEVRAAREVA